MTEAIEVSKSLGLHAAVENHVKLLYQLICKNKIQLQQPLDQPQSVQSEENMREAMQGNVVLYQCSYARIFMISREDEFIGVISFNHIEPLNKTTEIGCWLDESHQGQRIISQAPQTLIHHYAQSGELRRFVIKCRVDNLQNNQVTLRNGFILEDCLKQVEFLNDAYDDVNLYTRIIDS